MKTLKWITLTCALLTSMPLQAQQNPVVPERVIDWYNEGVTADTTFHTLPALTVTDVHYRATISLVSTPAYFVVVPSARGVTQAPFVPSPEDGTNYTVGSTHVVTWPAQAGVSYGLQMTESCTINLTVEKVKAVMAVAGGGKKGSGVGGSGTGVDNHVVRWDGTSTLQSNPSLKITDAGVLESIAGQDLKIKQADGQWLTLGNAAGGNGTAAFGSVRVFSGDSTSGTTYADLDAQGLATRYVDDSGDSIPTSALLAALVNAGGTTTTGTGYFDLKAKTSASASLQTFIRLNGDTNVADIGTRQIVWGSAIGTSTVGLTVETGRLKATNASTGASNFVCNNLYTGGGGTTSTWILKNNSGTIIEIVEGDDSDVDTADIFRFGNGASSGRPALQGGGLGVSVNPGHTFVGDTDTGMSLVEADALALCTQGIYRQIISNAIALTDATATNIITIPLTAGNVCGGHIDYVIRANFNSGQTLQCYSGRVYFSAADDTGVLTAPAPTEASASSSALTDGSTITDVWSILDGTNQFSIRVTADSSLASFTSFTIEYTAHISHTTTTSITIP